MKILSIFVAFSENVNFIWESLSKGRAKFKQVSTVQSRFSDIKFSDNLWFSDYKESLYFTKTIFQFTT